MEPIHIGLVFLCALVLVPAISLMPASSTAPVAGDHCNSREGHRAAKTAANCECTATGCGAGRF